MNSIQVRKIREGDLPSLVVLMRLADYRPKEWSLYKIKKYRLMKGHQIYVAEQDKKLIGYVGLKKVENEDQIIREILGNEIDVFGCIEWIAVHPASRKKGIASRLLAASENWLRREKRKGVWLDCRKKVVPLYEKNGYTIRGIYTKKRQSKYVLAKKF